MSMSRLKNVTRTLINSRIIIISVNGIVLYCDDCRFRNSPRKQPLR